MSAIGAVDDDADADADADDIREERGRGAAWTWIEELCAVLAYEAANARQMESTEEDRVAAANVAYVDYTREVSSFLDWPRGRAGTQEPNTRDESILARRATDATSTRVYKRAKLRTRSGLKKVRDAFAVLYRKYNFEPRSGTTSLEFYEECEASVKMTDNSNAFMVFRYVCPDSPHAQKYPWLVERVLKDMSINPRDRAPARTPSRGRKAQKAMKRSAAFAGLHPLSHAPRVNSNNAQFAMFNENMMTMWHTSLQAMSKISETIGVDLTGIIDGGLNKIRLPTDNRSADDNVVREVTASHSRLTDTAPIHNSADGGDVQSPGRDAQLTAPSDGFGNLDDDTENISEETARTLAARSDGASSPPRICVSPRKSTRARKPVNRLLQDNVN